MSKIMLFGQNSEEVSIPASEMLVKSAGFDIVNNEMCFIFENKQFQFPNWQKVSVFFRVLQKTV